MNGESDPRRSELDEAWFVEQFAAERGLTVDQLFAELDAIDVSEEEVRKAMNGSKWCQSKPTV